MAHFAISAQRYEKKSTFANFCKKKLYLYCK